MKKTKRKKITINKGSPRSNVRILSIEHQTDTAILGKSNDPVIIEVDIKKSKNNKRKNQRKDSKN